MIAIAAAIVALACSLASARRMYYATHATAWHPALLLERIGKTPDRATIYTQATATSTTSYDRFQQRFATVRAGRDAEIRLAKDLANQVKTRLAATLSATL